MRETDEIVIALHKFGAKHGVFATTGTVSPQSVREYESNYPGFELTFIDGPELVDEVVRNPLLKAVWLNDRRFGLQVVRLAVPFIIRDTVTDRALTPQELGLSDTFGPSNIVARDLSETIFAPYRAPLRWAVRGEVSGSLVRGFTLETEVRGTGARLSAEVRRLRNAVLQEIRSSTVVQVRFGLPHLVWADSTTVYFPTASDHAPATYVVCGNGSAVAEQRWVVPLITEKWLFPKPNFGTLEAEWVGWFNPQLECVMIPHISEPLEPRYDGGALIQREFQTVALRHSLFIGCSKRDAKRFTSLPKGDRPTWESRGVRTEYVLGWIHPAIRENFSYRQTADGHFELSPEPDLQPKHREAQRCFFEVLGRIRAAMSATTCRIVSWEEACELSALSDAPLRAPAMRCERRSAELFHYFSTIPSPLKLDDRTHVYVQAWSIPVSLSVFRRWLSRAPFAHLPFEIHANAGRNNDGSSITVLFSVAHSVGVSECVQDAIAREEIILVTQFSVLRETMKTAWQDAAVTTEKFWRVDIGLTFHGPSDHERFASTRVK